MFHSDAHINLSVERSIERRRAVQAYGQQRGTESAPSIGQTGGEVVGRRPAVQFAAALLVAIVIVGWVFASQAWM